MWNGKKKAITFSFDDGVTQDKRLIEIFGKYNLKGTFNLNSSLLGYRGTFLELEGKKTSYDRVFAEDIRSVYDGHEIAAHTLTHPSLLTMPTQTVIYQVERDRLVPSELCGYEVLGMAYPGGGKNNDERVADAIKNNTGVKYARTVENTGNFDLQKDYFKFNPSVHVREDNFEQKVEEFINLKTDEPKLLYIWGHAYEFDVYDNIPWERFESICQKLAFLPDVFYGTNKEVLLDE